MRRDANGLVALNKVAARAERSLAPSVATELLAAAVALVRKYSVVDGDFSVDSAAQVAGDLDYMALLARTGALNAVALEQATVEERTAFWLNVFHLLLLLSFVECFPYTARDRAANHCECALHVCGELLTLGQMEFCILRAAWLGSPLPHLPKVVVAAIPLQAVPHPRWALERDEAIHGALSYCCPGTPPLRVYREPGLREQMRRNLDEYLTSPSSYSLWLSSDAGAERVAGHDAQLDLDDVIMVEGIEDGGATVQSPLPTDGTHFRTARHTIALGKGKEDAQ